MNDVLAVAELKNGVLGSVSKEVVSAARGVADALGSSLHAVATGQLGTANAASGLAFFGADRIVGIESDDLGPGRVDVRAGLLADHIGRHRYGAVLFAATARGKDLAPRVAAKLESPLLSDVTALEVDSGEIVATRPVFAGKALARVRIPMAPALVSVRPNVFPGLEASRDAVVLETVRTETTPCPGGYRVKGFEASEGAAIDVSEAAVVVSGGRGMKGPENWHLLGALRDALGEAAALGASRAVVDAGWRPHSEQVGQTGKTVTPKLYFALGISGAIQHLAGMRTSEVIVSVNRDADAPIFGVADYGIVGDVFEVVPELTKAIRELRES